MDIILNGLDNVADESWGIGGFIGENDDSEITDCYARGSISATGAQATSEAIGGFSGYNASTEENCYSTGLITTNGIIDIGGFCGLNSGGTITDCFWDTVTSGQPASDGGTGKTTIQMKTQSTFTDAGWDFGTIWAVSPCNNGYPCLLRVNPGCYTAPSVQTNAATVDFDRVTGEGN